MNKTNEEIIMKIRDGLVRELSAYGFTAKQVNIVLSSLFLPIHKAIKAKDEQCRQEKIELVESVPTEFKEWAEEWKENQLTKLKYESGN